MVLEATQCWKIDWDELELNKSNIGALHSVLLDKVSTSCNKYLELSAQNCLIFLPYSYSIL